MRSIVGSHYGNKYSLIYDRRCNQSAVDSRECAWFLFDKNSEFLGDFDSKKKAVEYLEKVSSKAA